MASESESSAVSFSACAADAANAERALAEAVEAGATGAEEREAERGVTMIVYAPATASEAVRDALARVLGADAVAAPAPVEPVDWSEAWKAGLRPIEVSPRLRIRASFETSAARRAQSAATTIRSRHARRARTRA